MTQTFVNSGTIRDYFRTVYFHKGKLISYNLLVLLMAVAVILFWPREYQSEAKLWIKIGRENAKLDPTATTGKTISIQENDREDEIKSVIDVLGSRGVVEHAVAKLGPLVVLGDEPLPGAPTDPAGNPVAKEIKNVLVAAVKWVKKIDPVSDHEEAVHEVIKHLAVKAERKSNVVSVRYESDSPALAQAIVAAVVDQFKIENSRIHNTEGSQVFLDSQLQNLQQRVDDYSNQLKTAKDEIGLATIDGHRGLLEMQHQSVQASRLSHSQKLAEARALEAELLNQLNQHPQTLKSRERLVPNTGRDLIRDRLYQLQVERMNLESMHKSHPRLTAIRKQEDEARRELDAQTTKDRLETTEELNTVHQALTLELARVRASIAGFQATLAKLDEQQQQLLQQFKELNEAEIGIRKLERNVELAVQNFMTYAANLEEARMDEELNRSAITNVSVAQLPTLEEKPTSPSKLVVGVLTVAAMFFGSVALIAGMLIVDDSVYRQDEVAQAVGDVPVIISVPNQREYRQVLH
jgi:uncharacterized protein involved in exopolysaccharide biosynthesis